MDDLEITRFVGGVNLYNDRYDTEHHSLFRMLNLESHCFDFYQTNIPGDSLQNGLPREPWYDAHAYVTGEATWDSFALTNPDNDEDIRHWNAQVFRSIDRVSTNQLPRNLTSEQSIHEDYIEAIIRADRFIYIENQYFIGGCHLWDKDKNSGGRNLVPVEIALKVESKVKRKERFAVYVVIPEGSPEMDDLYILIGSANVNQRSMDDSRDTEIDIGCYQFPLGNPKNDSASPRDILDYQMSLWYEHTGLAGDIFLKRLGMCVQNAFPRVTVVGLVEDAADSDGNFPDG
ncbi:hypothetical protein F3Y22_tig00116994pilonHSYRG00040 [Hibiscus syriacus]|uniref:Phospholipase D n=1 Tax=Hibiscus syriacus TaxID=106335 RepID=A0A6A2XGA0_HIBSY|nr:hypothetical protein F3Y22_tig00116994pilonHSYRG00040 [Hibiscus syriacus]